MRVIGGEDKDNYTKRRSVPKGRGFVSPKKGKKGITFLVLWYQEKEQILHTHTHIYVDIFFTGFWGQLLGCLFSLLAFKYWPGLTVENNRLTGR